MPENDRFLTQIFQKYWPWDHGKNWFFIFGLVHDDAKLHEDSKYDLIFPNFARKSDRKWRLVARLGDMSMRSKMWKPVINQCFWPLLHEKYAKISSDSESSCNLRRHVLNQKLKINFFGDPLVSTFKKLELKIDHSFYNKITFSTDFCNCLQKKKGTIGKYRWFPVDWPTISEPTGDKTSNGGVLDLSFDCIIAGPI